MKSVDRIVNYMKYKAQLSHPIYFTLEDEKVVRGWRNKKHDMVWGRIAGSYDDYRFGSVDCPFCIYHNNVCGECSYSKRHGKCSWDYSEWQRLVFPKISGVGMFGNMVVRDEIKTKLGEFVTLLNDAWEE